MSLAVNISIHRSGHGQQFRLEATFEAPPGITILFGPSGSGKSTILQSIAGLLRPDEGCITLGEQTWFDARARLCMPPNLRHVAYVFQSLALFPHMTALGNVGYGLSASMPKAERKRVAVVALEKLNVGHLAQRKPRTFSGGEAQRVALARALAMSPKVILLDEPFSALDRDLRVQLACHVRQLVDELQVPLVQVTHNHGEARALGDQVILMDKGRICSRGTADEVLGESDHGSKPDRFAQIGKTPLPTFS